MKKEVLIDNEYVSLWVYPEARIVHHKIKQTMPPGVFPGLLRAGAEWLVKNRAIKWLSDDTNNVLVSQEDNEWGDKNWAPKVVFAGFRYWAVVMPEDKRGKTQMQRFVEENQERGITVRVFKAVEDALNWLLSVS